MFVKIIISIRAAGLKLQLYLEKETLSQAFSGILLKIFIFSEHL